MFLLNVQQFHTYHDVSHQKIMSSPSSLPSQSQSQSLFELIPHDCIGVILSFMDTRDWIRLSYTCRALNRLKYDRSVMVHKQRTLCRDLSDIDQIHHYLSLCRGTLFNVSWNQSRWINDDTFAMLQGTIHTGHEQLPSEEYHRSSILLFAWHHTLPQDELL